MKKFLKFLLTLVIIAVVLFVGLIIISIVYRNKQEQKRQSIRSNWDSYTYTEETTTPKPKATATPEPETEDETEEVPEEELTEEETTEEEPTPTPEAEATHTGIRPEFRQAMDDYVEFYEEYCDFMKKYNASEDTSSMLADYFSFMEKEIEMTESFEKLDGEGLSDEETDLYLETNEKVLKMLTEVLTAP